MPIKRAIQKSSSLEEFQEKLENLFKGENGPQLREDYSTYQKAYNELLTTLAEAPQTAYDEVAALLKRCSDNKIFMDFDHANNMSYNKTKKRFEFCDLSDYPNPVMKPSTIDSMVTALFTNDNTTDFNEVKRRLFLLQDEQYNNTAFEKAQTILEKSQKAEGKHKTRKAYFDAAKLYETQRKAKG